MGERLRAGLARFREHPWVGDVRGLGLAASIDFLCRDGDDRPVNQDADERAAAVCGRLLDEGVIARPAGRNVIFAPPLIIQADEVDEVVRRVGRALEAALNKDRG
jgi:4-aminobutyrate--pyruvate transaminase